MESIFFVPTQQRNLSFDLKNNSSAKVENVTIEVIERVLCQPRFEQQTQEFSLSKYVIDGSSHRADCWMSSTQIREEEYVSSLSPTSRMMDVSQNNNVKLCIPHTVRDTYSGRMIQV